MEAARGEEGHREDAEYLYTELQEGDDPQPHRHDDDAAVSVDREPSKEERDQHQGAVRVAEPKLPRHRDAAYFDRELNREPAGYHDIAAAAAAMSESTRSLRSSKPSRPQLTPRRLDLHRARRTPRRTRTTSTTSTTSTTLK